MSTPYTQNLALETRLSKKLTDVFIRVGLIFALAALCYRIFSPFLSLMVWALILAVTIYPAHQKLARKMGGKQGLSATLLTLGGAVLIVLPAGVFITTMPNRVAASRSMLSTPTPARTMALSRLFPSSDSAVMVTPLRQIAPSNSARADLSASPLSLSRTSDSIPGAALSRS